LWAILYMLLYGGMLITLYILNLVARVGWDSCFYKL
jgi:hypothetical protein